MSQNEKIINYYRESLIDYKLVWRLSRNLGIHAGYYDQKNKTHDKAVVNMNRIIARKAAIKSGEKVLDAGCGIGGTAIWIAKNVGAEVTGINICKDQLDIARGLVDKHGIDNKIQFVEGDFVRMDFPDNTFDVVYGLESICYAKDKGDFVREAWRVLRNGGRLVVADGFITKSDFDPSESREMNKWLEGWAVPNLAGVNAFRDHLTDSGFCNVKFEDVRDNVMPSSLRMYRASILCYPGAKFLELIGIRSRTQTENILSAYYQHRTLKNGLWTYGIFIAQK